MTGVTSQTPYAQDENRATVVVKFRTHYRLCIPSVIRLRLRNVAIIGGGTCCASADAGTFCRNIGVARRYDGCGSPKLQRTVSRAISSSSFVGITQACSV